MARADKPIEPATTGVQALIDRLRAEGVEAGRQEADRLVEDARLRASEIVAEARREAERERERARADADAEKRAAREALELAARDALIALKERLTAAFSDQLGRMVARALAEPATLEQLVLEVGGRVRPSADRPATVMLPDAAVGVDELRRTGGRETETDRALDGLVARIGAERLREGVSLARGGPGRPGLVVRLDGEDVEIDLTDEAVAEILRAHLLPRFRALLDGIVR